MSRVTLPRGCELRSSSTWPCKGTQPLLHTWSEAGRKAPVLPAHRKGLGAGRQAMSGSHVTRPEEEQPWSTAAGSHQLCRALCCPYLCC